MKQFAVNLANNINERTTLRVACQNKECPYFALNVSFRKLEILQREVKELKSEMSRLKEELMSPKNGLGPKAVRADLVPPTITSPRRYPRSQLRTKRAQVF